MQQTDSISDYQRHQLAEALSHCVSQLRSTAAMVDNYVAFIQGLPHATTVSSFPMQNIFPMFPPQAGAQSGAVNPAPVTSNGIHPPPHVPVQTPARGRKRRDAEPDVEGTVKKKRRRPPGEKKERDPNAPKRPPSAYLIFQNEVREEMKKLHPGAPYIEVLTKISERWSKMSDEEKKIYVNATNDMRAKFDVDRAAYFASIAEQHGVSLPGSANTPAASATATNAAPITPTIPTAPITPPPATPPPATIPVMSDSGSEDEEEGSEASSEAAVSAEVGESPDTSSDSDASSEDAPTSKPAAKKQQKPPSKKVSAASTKPASKAKTEKESGKKSKKSKTGN